MARAYCEQGLHYPERLIADNGVLLDNEGNATNNWFDGIAGISDADAGIAEDDEESVCAEHHCYINWEHD